MPDRIEQLSATPTKTRHRDELPKIVGRIARLWAEIYMIDPELARELADKLPKTRILSPQDLGRARLRPNESSGGD